MKCGVPMTAPSSVLSAAPPRSLLAWSMATSSFLSLFPSTFNPDFIVQFTRTGYAGYADAFLDFAEALERLLGRKVDLLTERMIRNPYFRASVEATRQIVYEN